ncbi:MAG: flagellar biosynthetic protein FliO [Gammaproteobacteria bacterium]|nr:flagellar biosynthetic protein FliO [Gammaproteobacteria bacterium]
MKNIFLIITIFCLIVFPAIGFTEVGTAEEGTARAKELANVSPLDVSGSVVKVIFGLLLVVVAIFASAWFFRRFGSVSSVPSDSLKIIGGLNIGNREKLMLVQVGEKQILIGVTSTNIQTLHVLEESVPVSSTVSVGDSFSAKLNQAVKQWKAK